MAPAVLYDAAVDLNPWIGVGIAAFFLVAALVSYFFLRRSRFGREHPRNALLIAGVWLITPLAPLIEVPHEFSMRTAVREGRAHVIEGYVENIQDFRQHRGSNTMCFTVGDVHLEIVPYHLKAMLQGGERVRVHYVGDIAYAELVRLEIL